MYDSNGNVKPTRLSALLNAALGYVADQTEGFIDFDAVPQEGASIQVRLETKATALTGLQAVQEPWLQCRQQEKQALVVHIMSLILWRSLRSNLMHLC